MDLSYNETLLKLLNNEEDKLLFTDRLLVNIYLTLLSLNNNYYDEKLYTEELNNIEDFLRKINNLKVKIQLKRKEKEITDLHNEIKTIYQNKKNLIDNYNINNLDIISLLDTLEPNTLTNLIDSLTKEKLKRVNHKEYYEKIRNEIITNSLSNYHLDNDILFIGNTNVHLDDFYLIFSYLLNIDNYPKKYTTDKTNNRYLNIVHELISIIKNNTLPTQSTIIPITLTYLLTQDINYEPLNTNNFNILNIKITDLYSFAKTESNNQTAKWKNISIPNEYLYHKIKEITHKGMYYFENDNFIIENIENNLSDFKISINISAMHDFLKEILDTKNQSPQID